MIKNKHIRRQIKEYRIPKTKNRSLFFALGFLLSVLCILSGCSEQSRTPPPERSAASSRFAAVGLDRTGVMEVAESVLTRMNFAIDKFDPNSGIIITRPLPGAQFFEFWRSENIGIKNWINSNLHSIRRTVECRVGTSGRDNIDCTVKIQRLSLPERQVTSSARAYEMFSRSNPALQRLQLNPEQERKMAWVDMGTDTELEKEIVKRIEKQLTVYSELSTTKDEL